MLPDELKDECMLVSFKHDNEDKGYYAIPLEMANYIYVGALYLCKDLKKPTLTYQGKVYGKYAQLKGNYTTSEVDCITLIPLNAVYSAYEDNIGIVGQLHIRPYNVAENPYKFNSSILNKLQALLAFSQVKC